MITKVIARKTARSVANCVCAVALALTAIVGGKVESQAQSVQGLIAQKYNELGGPGGPLGKVLSNEMAATDGRGRYNLFQNGMIAWSSVTGPKSMQVIYRSGSHVVFKWGPTDPFNYDKFIVRWTINNGAANQRDIDGQGQSDSNYTSRASRTDGTFTLSLGDRDSVSFIVEGADKETFGSRARQGWTTPVWVGAAPKATAPVVPPSIGVTSTGSDLTTVFTVTGTGFTPSSKVDIRVVDDALTTQYYQQTATKTGQLLLQRNIPCIGGLYLHFSATDGRTNPQDATGNLWSNTVTVLCPGTGASAGAPSASSGDSDPSNEVKVPAGKKRGALGGGKLRNQTKESKGRRSAVSP